MSKSRDAFRTISEVAEWLNTPTHVLRFWESKFSQVKPVKRAGGRRYYRPADMELLGGIKALLHDEGMTIKGVQKILREKGAKHVASLAVLPPDYDTAVEPDAWAGSGVAVEPDAASISGVPPAVGTGPDVDTAPERDRTSAGEVLPDAHEVRDDAAPVDAPPPAPQPTKSAMPDPESAPATLPDPTVTPPQPSDDPRVSEDSAPAAPAKEGPAEPPPPPDEPEVPGRLDSQQSPLPDFLKKPLAPMAPARPDAPKDETPTVPSASPADPELPAATIPAHPPVPLPPDPDLASVEVAPRSLSHLAKINYLDEPRARIIAPAVARLRAFAERSMPKGDS